MSIQLIAETAWHHDGDFKFMEDLVASIVDRTNTDYLKLHLTIDYDEYIHTDHLGYEWVKSNSFSEAQWGKIITYLQDNGVKPMLLFNDTKAVDFGMQYSPELVEIHSVCLNDSTLLKHLNRRLNKDTKVVLGVGGSDLYEIEAAINTLDTDNIVLMHGFQNYPTKLENINLSKIKRIMEMYPQYEHGYADHTFWSAEENVLTTVLGAALGMNYIEKHVTCTTGEGRTDWQAAVSIDTFNEIHKQLKIVAEANGDGLLKMNEGEQAYSQFGPMKKAAILIKDVSKGEVLTEDNFRFKRTAQVSDLSQLEVINSIGKTFVKDARAGKCIISKDIQ